MTGFAILQDNAPCTSSSTCKNELCFFKESVIADDIIMSVSEPDKTLDWITISIAEQCLAFFKFVKVLDEDVDNIIDLKSEV